MDRPQVGPEDVDTNLTPEAADAMLGLTLWWAKFDSALTTFVLSILGTSYDNGSIFIGNMQTRDKIEKLKAIYKHYDMQEAVQSIANLEKLHKLHVDLRNAIAHQSCLGTYRANPRYLVFAGGRVERGKPDQISGTTYAISNMLQATDFAKRASKMLFDAAAKIERPQAAPPPEPPSFQILPDPNPQKSEEGKLNKPRQERQR